MPLILPTTDAKVSRSLQVCPTSYREADAILRAQCGVTLRTVLSRLQGHLDQTTHNARLDGAEWYGAARQVALDLSRTYALPLPIAAYVIAALSPRTRWNANVRAAYDVLAGRPTSGAILPSNIARANAVIGAYVHATFNGLPYAVEHAFLALGDGPKVQAFAQNVSGNLSHVTIDVWAARAALIRHSVKRGDDIANEHCEGALSRKGVYNALSYAYSHIAKRHGYSPAQVQAIVWVQVRGNAQ